MKVRPPMLLFALCLQAALAGDITLTTGPDFSTYDDPRTEQRSLPLSLGLHTGAWTFDASGAYLYRGATPADAKPKGGGRASMRPIRIGNRVIWVPNPPGRPVAGSPAESGMGDITLDADYNLVPAANERFALDLRGAVTVPTGSEDKGFSTGRTDWTLGTMLSRGFGPLYFSLTANHTFVGHQAGVDSRNYWATDLYGGYGFNDGSMVGLDYGWAQSSTPGTDSSRTVSVSYSLVMTRREKLAFTFAHGFGSGDPNADVNVAFSHTFQ